MSEERITTLIELETEIRRLQRLVALARDPALAGVAAKAAAELLTAKRLWAKYEAPR